MSSIEQTGRTVDDAVKNALKILGVSREDVEVEVLSQESRGLLGILGYSEAKVRVTVKATAAPPVPAVPPEEEFAVAEPALAALEVEAEPAPPWTGEPSPLALRAQEVLAKILALMNLTARAEITREDDEAVYLTIQDEEDLGLLIGKQGHTLGALQVLVATIANHPLALEERKRIIVDAADYRARRERTLISMAHGAAEKAKRTGREVPLEPLNPRERRIVHVALATDSGVTTRSEGEDPERFIVIVPTGPRPPSRERDRGDRGGRSGPRR